jgi:site-specific DNA-cytosine methylase
LSKRRKEQSSKPSLRSNTGALVLDGVHVHKKRIRRELHIDKGNQHILAAFGIKSDTTVIEEGLPIVDLFCCIGGYSTGATQAGHRIVLAVDNDPIALGIHAANHPDAVHRVMTLGPETQDELIREIRAALPPGCVRWHLHGSPPCTFLSTMRNACHHPNRTAEKLAENEELGMAMVNWYLDFVELLNPTTFSFEQVNHKDVRETLRDRMRSKRTWDFEVVKMWEYGVPQTRTRIIGGTRALIDRLRFDQTLRVATPTTIRQVVTPPENAMYIVCAFNRLADFSQTEEDSNGGFVNAEAEGRTRTLDEPCSTQMCKSLSWWTERFETIRILNINETLAIQTFPTDYTFPTGTRVKDKIKGVGNAIPPLFAKKLMKIDACK